jgi:hypothetical protein
MSTPARAKAVEHDDLGRPVMIVHEAIQRFFQFVRVRHR